MDIQSLINEKLSESINRHGKLTAFNKIGNKMTLYGYIRKVENDHIIWEDNEVPQRFMIRNVISFEEIVLK